MIATEKQIEKMAEDLKGFEINSYNLHNHWQSWHREVWLDRYIWKLYTTNILAPNYWTAGSADIYVCDMYEKYFWDCFPEQSWDDKEEDGISAEEAKTIVMLELCDADFYGFIVEFLRWIESKKDYENVDAWQGQKPLYQAFVDRQKGEKNDRNN